MPAMASRRGGRGTINYWPGFVDAVTTLLMVLMFVLTIFTVMQSVLRLTIDTLDPAGDDLASLLGQLRFRLDGRLRKAGLSLVWKVPDQTWSKAQSRALVNLAYLTMAALPSGVRGRGPAPAPDRVRQPPNSTHPAHRTVDHSDPEHPVHKA